MSEPTDGGFWQWVATGAIGMLSFFATLFTGTQMRRVSKIEQRANESMPRDEFNEYTSHVDNKIDGLHKRIGDEFGKLNNRIDTLIDRRHGNGN